MARVEVCNTFDHLGASTQTSYYGVAVVSSTRTIIGRLIAFCFRTAVLLLSVSYAVGRT